MSQIESMTSVSTGIDDAPPSELPTHMESPETHFGDAVYELLNQAFDAFGLDHVGELVRVKVDPTDTESGTYIRNEIENLRLQRTALGGSLVVMQRHHEVDTSISLTYKRSPGGKFFTADATFVDPSGSLSEEAALLPIVDAFSDGSILPKSRTE